MKTVKRMPFKVLVLILTLLVLGGCKSTTPTKTILWSDVVQQQQNNLYLETLRNFRLKSQSISYKNLWLNYVNTDYLQKAGIYRDEFEQRQAEIESGSRTCESVDWSKQQSRLFFSTSVHLAAQECYESLGETTQADYHASAVSFVLQGLFANSDGKHHYSAHEVATAADASDIIRLSGYEVIDNYIELGENNRGLYYVFVVNDPDTREQKHLYFDFSRFLHAVLDLEYPFGWLSDAFVTEYIEPFSQVNSVYKFAKAQLLVADEKYDEAAQQYLVAIANNSVVANYRLGLLCRQVELSVVNKSECFDYLLASATGGYAKGVIMVAKLLLAGEGLDSDEDGFEQLMKEAQVQMPDGQAWFWLALATDEANKDSKIRYFERGAAQGSIKAKLKVLKQSFARDEDGNLSEADLQSYIEQFQALAEQGDARIKTHLARFIDSGSKPNPELTKLLLLEAADKGYPEANYQLGEIYRYGKNEPSNNKLAERYYLLAAQKFHYGAQLSLGLMYDHGLLGYDRVRAFSWFSMCSTDTNMWCLHNMGVLIRDGYISGIGDTEARGIFEFLSRQEHSGGMNSYGHMLENGRGGNKDLEQAFVLYKKAANVGERWAQMNLCLSYAIGRVVEKDKQKAIMWCEKSAEQGVSRAINKLRELRAE